MEKSPSGTGSPYREKLLAKALLLKMRRLEPTIVPKECSPLVAEMRKGNAERYRKSVGIAPADRATLRVALEGIMAGSRANVAEVLGAINAGTFTQTGNREQEAIEPGLSEWL